MEMAVSRGLRRGIWNGDPYALNQETARNLLDVTILEPRALLSAATALTLSVRDAFVPVVSARGPDDENRSRNDDERTGDRRDSDLATHLVGAPDGQCVRSASENRLVVDLLQPIVGSS
jgi:hypothetical protein